MLDVDLVKALIDRRSLINYRETAQESYTISVLKGWFTKIRIHSIHTLPLIISGIVAHIVS